MADTKRKIALLSNVTVDLVIGKLRSKYDFYQPDGYDAWIQDVINPNSKLYGTDIDAYVVLLDGTEARNWKDEKEGLERIALWKEAVSILADKVIIEPVFISTIDIRENRIKALSERKNRYSLDSDWYQHIQGLVENKDNVFVLDIADTIADIGRNQFYSNKMWYMSSMPYSRDGINAVVKEIDRVLCSSFSARKKIIALDLDNTLWGGVIGEDGIDGIQLSNHKEGERFFDFQCQLLEMKNRGILLAIDSKNNIADAEAAIQQHPSMLLRDDCFVSKKINWGNKAINLKEMEKELNLTECGFIFIDDNPVERETVKGECPEVYVPEFPLDTTELLPFAENIWVDYCRPLRVLGEDLKKTEMYQIEAKRKVEISKSLNIDDYITKLEMCVDIHRMKESELDRVVQLINKTNQFNVTTKRYTKADVQNIAQDDNRDIYVVCCHDKYGDLGLISVFILVEEACVIKIDTFLMSCRVMGRKLEDVIVNEILSRFSGKIVIGEYIPTEKNAPVKDLYERLGFSLLSDDSGHKLYELKAYQKRSYEFYKEISFEE